MNKDNKLPRCMIAAAQSGSGKTTLTCALIGALNNRGLKVAPFKCGPDYIDPMFHRSVLGADCVNLDPFLAGKQGVRELVCRTACDEDKGELFAVMEGVMGIYDGTSPAALSGSSYEIASITDTPVMLVMDAGGIGRTVISLIKGILADDEKGLIRGVILNRMSDAFYERIYPVLTDEIARTGRDIKILGHIPKCTGIDISSRHLGLTLPGETEDLSEKLRLVTSIVEEKCDIDALIKIMTSAPEIADEDEKRKRSLPVFCGCGSNEEPIRIAVAEDEAFCFYYTENMRLLKELGVQTVDFSPLRDRALPEGVSGVIFGGGYPELYLEQLSSNIPMLLSIRSATEAGMPSIAECGGFIYLHRSVEDMSGKEYELAGVIDGKCTYTGHLVNFGYVEIADCEKESCLRGMRGHEFHYYDSTSCGSDCVLVKPATGRKYNGMIVREGCLWGFPHMYYPSAPGAVAEFVRCCRIFRGDMINGD